jgi:hypothetical protein
MGEFDSSLTRVVPVFNALMDKDPAGHSWLPILLKLGSLSAGKIEALPSSPLIAEQQRWWGDNERPLDAPKGLLHWLVDNLGEPTSKIYWGDDETRAKRKFLVAGDSKTIAEAHLLLDSQPPRYAWYVLEGQSRPDAYLETDNLIIVIEGKRTERKPTTATTWMPQRSQMLRHMDAAWEIRKNKKVFGMMIVEGPGDAEAITPSGYWLEEAKAQIKSEMMEASLPHRIPEERMEIATDFLGVTTWQRVCSEFHLPWPPIADKS